MPRTHELHHRWEHESHFRTRPETAPVCDLRPTTRRQCHARAPTNADVPFWASGTMATVVVLERRSAPERVRLAVPTTPDTERVSACCSTGAGGIPRLLLLMRPDRHFEACGNGSSELQRRHR